jgi:tetratricopeptide (TPR) repeat protein
VLNKYLKTLLNGGVPEKEVNPLQDGLAFFEAGDYDNALPNLELALETDPHNVQALIACGRMHLELGRLAEAYERLRAALELDIKNPQLLYSLGELCFNQGDMTAAESYWSRAIVNDADYTDAHIRMGMLYSETGRYQEAIKCFERAIFLDRAAVVARYQLAQVCVRLDDHRRALTQLHLVKELHPDYPPVYILQGEIFFRLGDMRQAILELTKAVELGAGDANVHWMLGSSHLALKAKDKALRAFLASIEHDPENWAAYHQAAVLQEEMQRYAPAQQNYNVLLRVPEYQEVAQQGIERIENLLAEIAATLAGGDVTDQPSEST